MVAISSIRQFLPTLRIETTEHTICRVTASSMPVIALVSSSLMQPFKADTFTECIEAYDRNRRNSYDFVNLIYFCRCIP